MKPVVPAACLAVIFSFGHASSGFGADAQDPDHRESIVLRAAATSQYADGRLILETIKDLSEKSATFDEMLRTLSVSHLLTFISPTPDWKRVPGMMGHTRFAVGPSGIVAFVEVVMRRDRLRAQREAIAHELAHVVEVACLGPIASNEALRQQLRPQVASSSNTDPARGMETRFAVRAGKAILREAEASRRGASQLAELADHEGLTACPVTVIAPGSDLANPDPI